MFMVKSSLTKSNKQVLKKSLKKTSISIDDSKRVSVVNITRNSILHSAPRWAISTYSQAKGFMFEKPGNNAIIFVFSPPKKVSFHMWFVFGAIDVLGLDEHHTVIVTKENFRPWSVWSSQIHVSYILELPVGTIALTKTCIGDKIYLPVLPVK